MRTRKNAPKASKTNETSALPKPELSSSPPPPAIEDSFEKIKRFGFAITSEGKPDFSSMRTSTREQLSAMLRDPDVQKQLGVSKEIASAIDEAGFDEDEMNGILDFLQGVSAAGATMIYKIPREVTGQAFQFTPDMRKKLVPRGVRLLNKWGPEILKKWKEEIGFAMVFAASINAQIQMMHFLEARRQRQLKSARPAPVEIRQPASAPEPAPAPAPENSEVDGAIANAALSSNFEDTAAPVA